MTLFINLKVSTLQETIEATTYIAEALEELCNTQTNTRTEMKKASDVFKRVGRK